MYRLRQFAGYLALGIGLASAQSHASIIQSMSIEEIGVVSAGLGSSAAQSGGGQLSVYGGPPAWAFDSLGSADGAIIMGRTQGTNDFINGFMFFGMPALPHTLNGAPAGTITGNTMTLDLSGWGLRWANLEFMLFPDAGTLFTSVSRLDADHYYYTADWSHVITSAETPPPFAGIPVGWHLEGIATVPEPGTVPLLATSGLALLLSRRRKRP